MAGQGAGGRQQVGYPRAVVLGEMLHARSLSGSKNTQHAPRCAPAWQALRQMVRKSQGQDQGARERRGSARGGCLLKMKAEHPRVRRHPRHPLLRRCCERFGWLREPSQPWASSPTTPRLDAQQSRARIGRATSGRAMSIHQAHVGRGQLVAGGCHGTLHARTVARPIRAQPPRNAAQALRHQPPRPRTRQFRHPERVQLALGRRRRRRLHRSRARTRNVRRASSSSSAPCTASRPMHSHVRLPTPQRPAVCARAPLRHSRAARCSRSHGLMRRCRCARLPASVAAADMRAGTLCP